ncbi:Clusterin-associated protein 1 [Cichlidogyrus casuarinus]|uniref:Clusterin-associated protein 1 n=1 Tax=Cichlidogyrus casuarinus TaxID=1844966 RepID=A0ABD2QMP2_9PLAT
MGYPRTVSIDNFHTPNFRLVIEIIGFLAQKLDPTFGIVSSIDTQQNRLYLVKMLMHFFSSNAGLKIIGKRIYQADNHAIKEITKISNILYQTKIKEIDEISGKISEYFEMERIKEITSVHRLVSEILENIANLSILVDQKENEEPLRDFEPSSVRELIIKSTESMKNNCKAIETSIERIKDDEKNLQLKTSRKKQELERSRKRLTTLKSVRPIFTEEYEKLEEELKLLYDKYINNFRNIRFLEDHLNKLVHQLKSQEAIYANKEAEKARPLRRSAFNNSSNSSQGSSDDDKSDFDMYQRNNESCEPHKNSIRDFEFENSEDDF